jgi:Flp pilus assembly protein protease CpaA
MFEIILLTITLIGGFAAGIYDLKTSNVPDKLCLAMIAIGLIIHIYTGVATGDFTNFINSLLFGGLFLVFGLGMYYTGQWGGGDGELLVTFGILLPTVSTVNTYFPFAVSFFINSFFVGAAYSIIYSAVMMYRIPKMRRKFTKQFESNRIRLIIFSFFVVSLLFLLSSRMFFFWISITIVILILFQKFAKSVEQGFLIRIPVSKLQPDDTIGQDIPELGISKKLIRGLTKSEVRKIKRRRKHVIIKEGIRYGIVFPLSVIFTLFFGDFIFLFLSF